MSFFKNEENDTDLLCVTCLQYNSRYFLDATQDVEVQVFGDEIYI